jgi:hypothetical protein
MTDADDKVGLTLRVIVKLRPDEYDELFSSCSPDRFDMIDLSRLKSL